MFRLILKNLWNRRGRHAWLFIELMLVVLVAWPLLDRTTVLIYDTTLPMGYDVDRLLHIEVGSLSKKHRNYKPEFADSVGRMNAFHAFLTKVRALDGVEAATAGGIYSYMGRPNYNTGYNSLIPADSLVKPVRGQVFWTGTDFFHTIGIEALPRYGSEALSDETIVPGDVVFTESYARMFSPDAVVPGGKVAFIAWEGDSTFINIPAVVSDIRRSSTDRSYSLAFLAQAPEPGDNFVCVARLKDGVEPKAFIRDLRERAPRELVAGNYLVKTVTHYPRLFDGQESEWGYTVQYTRNIALTVFFILNLLLGVVGSCYLQTRRRVGEMGVHRAFGALKTDISRMLIGEAAMLATAAFVVGDILYLQYALYAGLDSGYMSAGDPSTAHTWVSSFGLHFTIISAMVYVLIMICVSVGTYFPAREASRVNPINALRNE